MGWTLPRAAVAPGAHRELQEIQGLPVGLRVRGAVIAPLPSGMPGDEQSNSNVWVLVESAAVARLGQPEKLTSMLHIEVPQPLYETGISTYPEDVPFFA